MAISNERFTTLFLNWWEVSEKDMTLSNMEDLAKEMGMTRAEFIELITQSNEFISKDGWTPEPKANEKVNTETGEDVFWKAYTEEEEDEEISEPIDKSTPVPDYFRFIDMLSKTNAQYRKLDKYTIELYDDPYTSVEFRFDTNFKLVTVEW